MSCACVAITPSHRRLLEALRLDPRSAHLFNNRGLAFHRRGDHDKALADSAPLSASIRVLPSPTSIAGVVHFARAELDKGDLDYTEALRYEPKSALIFNNRGYAYLEKESTTRPSPTSTRRFALDARFAAAFNNRGLAHCAKNKLGQAVADFSKAIESESRFRPGVLQPQRRVHRQGNAPSSGRSQ